MGKEEGLVRTEKKKVLSQIECTYFSNLIK
jgi:hypothetical protein